MIILVFLSIICSVIGEETVDGMKFCDDKKKIPYYCLFMKKTERLESCCFPVVSRREMVFQWNFDEKVDENGFISSFMYLNNPCKAAKLEGLKYLECVPREGISDDNLSPYPMHRSQFSMLSEEQAQLFYCNNKITSVYDFVLTCWLYDCEPRLKIPQKAKGSEKQAKNLCLPPILHKENKKKYCALYSNDKADEKSCFLPPVCGKDGKIDESEYLVPLVDGKPNAKYCEVLCPSNSNGGTFNGKPCRQVPICPPGLKTHVLIGADFNNTKTNPQKMHICYPFCTVEDSKISDPKDRKVKDTQCQPLPPCKTGAAPDTAFTGTNPFGAVECIQTEKCAEGETSDKKNCVPTDGESSSDKSGKPHDSGVTIIVVCVVVPLVLIGLAVGGVFFFLRRKRAKNADAAKSHVVMLKTISDGTPSGRGAAATAGDNAAAAPPADPAIPAVARTFSDIFYAEQDAKIQERLLKEKKRQAALEGSGRDISFKSARIITKPSAGDNKTGDKSKSDSSLKKEQK